MPTIISSCSTRLAASSRHFTAAILTPRRSTNWQAPVWRASPGRWSTSCSSTGQTGSSSAWCQPKPCPSARCNHYPQSLVASQKALQTKEDADSQMTPLQWSPKTCLPGGYLLSSCWVGSVQSHSFSEPSGQEKTLPELLGHRTRGGAKAVQLRFHWPQHLVPHCRKAATWGVSCVPEPQAEDSR